MVPGSRPATTAYLLRCRVFVVGNYWVEVHAGRAEEAVGGTPVALQIIPGRPEPRATTLHHVSVDGLVSLHGVPFPELTAGGEARFVLVARDGYANECRRGGSQFEMQLRPCPVHASHTGLISSPPPLSSLSYPPRFFPLLSPFLSCLLPSSPLLSSPPSVLSPPLASPRMSAFEPLVAQGARVG